MINTYSLKRKKILALEDFLCFIGDEGVLIDVI